MIANKVIGMREYGTGVPSSAIREGTPKFSHAHARSRSKQSPKKELEMVNKNLDQYRKLVDDFEAAPRQYRATVSDPRAYSNV